MLPVGEPCGSGKQEIQLRAIALRGIGAVAAVIHVGMYACLHARRVLPRRAGVPHLSQEVVMILLVVAAVLAVLWLLGVVAFHVTAFAIHLLLIAAVIAVIAHFTVGRRSGRTRV
jgi:DMSO reductase anchor subunit